ncbi:hypothetical protein EVAR_23352_1 [Eumeta japonica]|uniref:Endonuclease/exonuclease/phosphatase domain-containing protein n=1 Tax=Eumeta variegata TaxID=151549 RepID=A0A4C1XW65_EUMVA|nr:hypothetical protein EVAR_23352_1 [Eumeta japonica]
MEAIQNKMRSRKEIKVEAAKAANLLIMKGVMAYHKDADIIENVLAQNKHLVKDINLKEVTIRVWAHKAVAGKTATCSYCADKTHEWEKCPRRKQNEEPKCKNCWENGIKTEANHEAFSNKCKRSKVATAELLQLATEKGISIALVQEPYVGNQGILKQNPGTKVIQCTVGRQKPVKAAIIVFGDKVEETRTSSHISSERKGLQNLGTENLIIAGDINAWSHWWEARDRRGQAYRDFLDEMGFHILNTGSTPTFETYRGDRICSSIVDVTACSSPNR